ncbi:MAG: CsgG/HfaB family protein [Nitrospiria bacterium]
MKFNLKKDFLRDNLLIKERNIDCFSHMETYIFFLAWLLVFSMSSSGWSKELPGAALPKASFTHKEMKEIYRRGRYDQVISKLSNLNELDSTQALFLGLSYLREGSSKKAISAWQHYVHLEEGSEGGRTVSQYLTILMQREARRSARNLVLKEKNLFRKINPKAIAVSPFQNLGSEAFSPLSKGLAAMVMTDLSKVNELTVVERIEMSAILDELRLSKSGLVDKKTAPRVGRLVGAGKVTTGTYLDVEDKIMRLNAAVTLTENGRLLSASNSSGEIPTFYILEKRLVFQILCGIGYCPENLDKQVRLEIEKVHTKNFQAFRFYSEGLDFLDQGKYRKASQAFFFALEEDPAFKLARKALLETPILPFNLDAMIAGGESIVSGENTLLTLGPLLVSPLPVKVAESDGTSVRITPEIFQQPVTAIKAGAPANVQVQIQINISESGP